MSFKFSPWTDLKTIVAILTSTACRLDSLNVCLVYPLYQEPGTEDEPDEWVTPISVLGVTVIDPKSLADTPSSKCIITCALRELWASPSTSINNRVSWFIENSL